MVLTSRRERARRVVAQGVEILAGARARHDVALALTALLEHGFGGAEAATWTEERDQVVAELGIRDIGSQS